MNIPLTRSSLLKEGTYKVRIISAEDGQGPSGPLVKLTLAVLENGRPTDHEIITSLSMSKKARFMVDAFLDAIEAPEDGTLNSRNLRGKTLYAAIGKQVYNGRTSNTVTGWLTPAQAEKAGVATDGGTNGYDPSDEDEDEDDSTPQGYNPLDDEEDFEKHETVAAVPDELSEDEDIPY